MLKQIGWYCPGCERVLVDETDDCRCTREAAYHYWVQKAYDSRRKAYAGFPELLDKVAALTSRNLGAGVRLTKIAQLLEQAREEMKE